MQIPSASVKELRSTGYFFDELKDYAQSSEVEISIYCNEMAVPYLVRVSDSLDRSGKPERSEILRLAIRHLSSPDDSELVDAIFKLKKLALSEIDKAVKANLEEHFDRSASLANNQRLESAELLVKLLVNIIKLYRLAQPVESRREEDAPERPAHSDFPELEKS